MEDDELSHNTNRVRNAASRPGSEPSPDGAGEPASRDGSVPTNNDDDGTSVPESAGEERPPRPYNFRSSGQPPADPLVARTPAQQTARARQTARADEAADPVGSMLEAVSRSPFGGPLQALGLLPPPPQGDASLTQVSEETVAPPPQQPAAVAKQLTAVAKQPAAVTKKGAYQK